MGERTRDESFMRQALYLAEEAGEAGEAPIGCVIVLGDRIVGQGKNSRETGKNALGHAEIAAIDQACRTLGGWRLWQCRLYVTLEPCPMCAGAIINARIPTVIYGTADPKAGAVDTKLRLFDLGFNHRPEVISGVLEQECAAVLTGFFKKIRTRKRLEKQAEKTPKSAEKIDKTGD